MAISSRALASESLKLVGYKVEFCQDNESMSSYGVMRGLHFQRPPFTQSKLVRCVKGRVIIIPSFLTLKEGSTFLTKPLFPQEREYVTALRCSEPLRSKVGGPSKVYVMVVRDGTALLKLDNKKYIFF